jgi:PP-loop superfamily ATP-utilizing enzyme
MNKQEMIQHMCNYYLSDTDIKAIAKNRGFSATETKNRQIFQNYFLSDIGLKKTMASSISGAKKFFKQIGQSPI